MYHIIMNPTSKSGKGLSIWRTLQAILSEKGIPYMLHESTYTGHVTELTRQITSTQQKINLILLGGDGTINEALQGIQDFDKVSIGYIPTGSSNDLARALKLSRDPAKLLRQILDGTHAHMMDLGILTYESDSEVTSRLHRPPVHKSRYFIVSSGIGFDAAVCEEALSSPIKDALSTAVRPQQVKARQTDLPLYRSQTAVCRQSHILRDNAGRAQINLRSTAAFQCLYEPSLRRRRFLFLSAGRQQRRPS